MVAFGRCGVDSGDPGLNSGGAISWSLLSGEDGVAEACRTVPVAVSSGGAAESDGTVFISAAEADGIVSVNSAVGVVGAAEADGAGADGTIGAAFSGKDPAKVAGTGVEALEMGGVGPRERGSNAFTEFEPLSFDVASDLGCRLPLGGPNLTGGGGCTVVDDVLGAVDFPLLPAIPGVAKSLDTEGPAASGAEEGF